MYLKVSTIKVLDLGTLHDELLQSFGRPDVPRPSEIDKNRTFICSPHRVKLFCKAHIVFSVILFLRLLSGNLPDVIRDFGEFTNIFATEQKISLNVWQCLCDVAHFATSSNVLAEGGVGVFEDILENTYSCRYIFIAYRCF